MTDEPTRPTGVRHLIVLLLVLMSLLLYLDRLCVSFAVDYIKEDLGLTQTQISWFLSIFFWSYALAQVPSGWLSDRYGARRVLALYVVAWSLFTAQMGVVAGFVMLMIARLGCGLGQAGAYPTSGGVISRWIPISKRATASAWVGLGGRIGGAIAPLLTAYLMVVFVPVGTSVQFTDADLLDASKLTNILRASQNLETTLSSLEIGAAARRLGRFAAPDLPLTESLNALLNRRDLFDEAAFGSLKLPDEALKYLERIHRGEKLDEKVEWPRMNRLLIEAAFPGEIRKLYGRGWRPVVIIYGLCGLVVAFGIWWVFRERPEQHPWVNATELSVIAAGVSVKPASNERAGRLPIRPFLTDLSLWSNCACQVGTNIGWLFLVTWISRYFIEMHNVPILERGKLVMMPGLIGMCGGYLGGRWCDWLLPRVGLKWSRRLPPVLTRFLAAGGYGLCLIFASLPEDSLLNSPWAFTVAFCIVYFAVDLGQSAVWAYAQDAGGKYVGSVLGWGNMWGNLGAAVSPLMYNAILGETPTQREWNNLFWLGVVAFLAAGVCALGLDATKPVFSEEATSKNAVQADASER
jgi:MFS family permease